MGKERVVVADDGVRLWSVATGAAGGVPVVMCHGGPGLWDDTGPVAAMVGDLARVVRWDQRGAGRSEPVGPYSVGRCIDDLDAVRRAWGLDRVVVAGHSWGAGLALRYAVAHPDRVAGLVALAGTDLGWPHHRAAYRAERRRRLAARGRLARWEALSALPSRTADEEREWAVLTWSTDHAHPAHGEALARASEHLGRPINLEANAAIGRDLAGEDEDALARAAAALGVPALVVHGTGDPRPGAGPAALARTLPRATLAVVPGVGHVPWVERPHLLRRSLRRFLAAL